MLKKYSSLISVFILLFLVACATKPESDVDTPEYHFKAGIRAIWRPWFSPCSSWPK